MKFREFPILSQTIHLYLVDRPLRRSNEKGVDDCPEEVFH